MSEVVEGAEDLAPARGPDALAPPGVRCDFCQAVVSSVRRIALDQGYERLQTAHRERYACAACSHRKEQERLGRTQG